MNKITAERNQLDADLQALQNELLQLQQQGDSPSLSDTTSADDKAKLETKISEITTKIEALKQILLLRIARLIVNKAILRI